MSKETKGLDKVLEKVADLEHQQWSHWTKYFLDNLTEENIKRWRRQIDTPYLELSEKEKESDRKWARKVIDLIYHTAQQDLKEELREEIKGMEIKIPPSRLQVQPPVKVTVHNKVLQDILNLLN